MPPINQKVLMIIGSFFLSFCIFAYLTQSGLLGDFLLWLGKIGLIGNLFLILFYLITSFPVPMGTSPLALAAGFLYGITLGLFTVTVGSIVGAIISFWACRKIFSDWVSLRVRSNQGLMAVMAAVEKHAFKMCFFVRMSPIPFGMQNSLFAISKIKFTTYCSASLLGLFPEQLMLVYFGSTAKDLKDIFDGKVNFGLAQQVIMVVQIIVCISILGFLTYTGRKAFQDATKDEEIAITK